MSRELVLIDLSSIAHPIWHTNQADPDVNKTSQLIVTRVHALASAQRHVAICCDSGKSFRKDIAATYKANRPEHDAALMHQIALAREQLEADGFPVWAVKMFEADDLIASAVALALKEHDLRVLVVSADKDLLQLVGPRVNQMKPDSGVVLDEIAVREKFGVMPEQMRDFLTLVGDASDNITGVKGIGAVKAAAILKQFGSIDALYKEMADVGAASIGLQPAAAKALKEFQPTLPTTRALVTLRSDVPLPFAEVFAERVAKSIETFGEDEPAAEEETAHVLQMPAQTGTVINPPAADAPRQSTAVAVREPDVLAAPPAEWERQLDPRSMREAITVAKDLHASRMFADYGTPHAVLSTIMLGRELGLPAMGSLRTVHIIEGKHSLSASLMVALVLKSGLAEYFEPVSFSDIEATYETLRKGARNPVRLQHTIEMGRQAWPKAKADWEKAFLASGWGKNPTDMLVARAQSRLARMVYPDLLAGLYTPEELADIRAEVA
jgi:5'-3' exonuclease